MFVAERPTTPPLRRNSGGGDFPCVPSSPCARRCSPSRWPNSRTQVHATSPWPRWGPAHGSRGPGGSGPLTAMSRSGARGRSPCCRAGSSLTLGQGACLFHEAWVGVLIALSIAIRGTAALDRQRGAGAARRPDPRAVVPVPGRDGAVRLAGRTARRGRRLDRGARSGRDGPGSTCRRRHRRHARRPTPPLRGGWLSAAIPSSCTLRN